MDQQLMYIMSARLRLYFMTVHPNILINVEGKSVFLNNNLGIQYYI